MKSRPLKSLNLKASNNSNQSFLKLLQATKTNKQTKGKNMKLIFKLNNPNNNKTRIEDFEFFKHDVKEFIVEESKEGFAIEIRQAKLIELIENQLNNYIEDMRVCMECKQIIKVSEPCSCYDLEAYCFQEINMGDFEFKDLNETMQSRIREDAQD